MENSRIDWHAMAERSRRSKQRPVRQILRELPGMWSAQDHLIGEYGSDERPTVLVSQNIMDWFHDSVEELTFPLHSSCILFDIMHNPVPAIPEIVNKYGGVKDVRVKMAEIFSLTELQPTRQSEGPLLDDPSVENIFFVSQKVRKKSLNYFSYTDASGRECKSFTKITRHLFQEQDNWYILRMVGLRFGPTGWYISGYETDNEAPFATSVQVCVRDDSLANIDEIEELVSSMS